MCRTLRKCLIQKKYNSIILQWICVKIYLYTDIFAYMIFKYNPLKYNVLQIYIV